MTLTDKARAYASKFPRKSEHDKPERYSTLMLYEVRDEVEEAFLAGHAACAKDAEALVEACEEIATEAPVEALKTWRAESLVQVILHDVGVASKALAAWRGGGE
jgi:hypothetical protein